MKKYLWIIAALPLLLSCIEEDFSACARRYAVPVTLEVQPARMAAVSRAADEETVRDLNLYLLGGDGRILLHRYQRTPTLRFAAVPGVYRLRLAANMGRDLGEAPAKEDFTVPHADEYDLLPMAWEGDLAIPAAGGTLPAVEVQRTVAKISYDISVLPSDIELQSVQLHSVPRTVSVFDTEAAPSADPADYTDCPETALSGRSAAGTSYLLPNMQGVVLSITDQRQKNADNAPANASYLLIRATRGAKVLAYCIYLGGNNTSDFDVRANTHYRFDISILGDDEVDTRVWAYTAAVEDSFGRTQLGEYCCYTPSEHLTATLDGGSHTPAVRGRIEVTEGDAAAFGFDGASGAVHDFPLPAGSTEYPIRYAPKIYTAANHRLHYRVTLTDEYGFSQRHDFRRAFGNRLDLHASQGGAVRAESPLYFRTEAAPNGSAATVLCLDECRLRAVPEAGYAFDGWYADDQYTQRLSTEVEYTYRPTDKRAAYYVRFLPPVVALDTGGTANCYLAPGRNARYSFDAATMGNGEPTKGILPQPLSGTEARVLWETGPVRGAVVASAAYAGGRIEFQTGPDCGNALIGLFDAAGACVWSWHIWAVDYTPEAAAQLYASGFVFMDRNLRALNADPADASARGLYYQWGRKDPFPYPADASGGSMAAVCCLGGYGFEAYDRAEPEYYTIEWATAHPTAFLSAAPEPGGAVCGSWCCPVNDNLWGYSVTDQDGAAVTAKSVYDPCPPGWRTPPQRAWDADTFRKASAAGAAGWRMHYAAGQDTALYPYTGYLVGRAGSFAYYWLSEQVQPWTNEPRPAASAYGDKDKAYYLYITDKGLAGCSATATRDQGMPVRCVRE